VLIAAASMGCAAAAQEAGGQSLEQTASDPTASLTSFQLQAFYSPNVYNSDGQFNTVQCRAAIPFKLGWIGKAPLQIQGSYEHNLFDEAVRPEGTLGPTLKLLLPAG
jgi:hypothetical protein